MIRISNLGDKEVRQLEDCLDIDTLLELNPHSVGDFCDGALDTDVLIDELEEYGPFAPVRKPFCEFLNIGESTLTGWIKVGRVPRSAKVAYVLMVGLTILQSEVKRLRLEARELKIVNDGNRYQLVRFDTDDTGVTFGKIVARDIADAKTARVLAASVRAFRTLQETRQVIAEMLELIENTNYISYLEDLNLRICKDTLSAFDRTSGVSFSGRLIWSLISRAIWMKWVGNQRLGQPWTSTLHSEVSPARLRHRRINQATRASRERAMEGYTVSMHAA